MDIITIVLIAFGLSMDALAVSITYGATLKKVGIKEALRIGGFFGFFQALMPLLGWLMGVKFQNYIARVDHWIAFLLLSVIGGKMVYETLTNKEDCDDNFEKTLDNKTLFMLAIATSIDALAVGVSFAFLEVSILNSIIIIGIITFDLCFIGVLIGKKCGELLKRNAEIIGGIVLILIGIKILLEHLNIF